MGLPGAAQVAVIFRWLCSLCWMAPAGHWKWLTSYLLGGTRASTPGRQLQTTLDYNPTTSMSDTTHSKGGLESTKGSASTQQFLCCSQSQSSQPTGPGRQSFPVMQRAIKAQLQQDSAHHPHRSTPGAPSSGDWKGCTTEPCKTPTTRGYSTKSRRRSSSTY